MVSRIWSKFVSVLIATVIATVIVIFAIDTVVFTNQRYFINYLIARKCQNMPKVDLKRS